MGQMRFYAPTPEKLLPHAVELAYVAGLEAIPWYSRNSLADDVLTHATKGISEIITVPGLINVDFADVRSVMRGMGNALMGMGFSRLQRAW